MLQRNGPPSAGAMMRAPGMGEPASPARGRAEGAGAAQPKADRLGQEGHNCKPEQKRNVTRLAAFSRAAMPYRAEMAQRLAAVGRTWHLARAQGLGKTIADRVAACGTTHVELVTQDGEVIEKALGCNQSACSTCATRKGARWAARLRAVVSAHDKDQRRRNRQATLITLTVRHTGDLAADRKAISKGWKRWRAWWHDRYGWAFTFAFVWEVTLGTAGDGHVHAHVVAWLPKWWSWQKGQAAWCRATGGNIDFQVRGNGETVGQSVQYLVKYLAKGAALEGLTPALAAAWWAASYNKRAVSVSLHFWSSDETESPVYLSIHLVMGDAPKRPPHAWWLHWLDSTGPPD